MKIEECSEDIDRNEIVYNATLYNYEKIYKSYTLYIVLLITAFIIIIGTGSICLYFYYRTMKNCFNKLPY